MQDEGKGEMLKQYGTNLTELAQQGKLDPVIGRDAEIRRTLQMYGMLLDKPLELPLLVWREDKRTILF